MPHLPELQVDVLFLRVKTMKRLLPYPKQLSFPFVDLDDPFQDLLPFMQQGGKQALAYSPPAGVDNDRTLRLYPYECCAKDN
jgi:hypothetical protein